MVISHQHDDAVAVGTDPDSIIKTQLRNLISTYPDMTNLSNVPALYKTKHGCNLATGGKKLSVFLKMLFPDGEICISDTNCHFPVTERNREEGLQAVQTPPAAVTSKKGVMNPRPKQKNALKAATPVKTEDAIPSQATLRRSLILGESAAPVVSPSSDDFRDLCYGHENADKDDQNPRRVVLLGNTTYKRDRGSIYKGAGLLGRLYGIKSAPATDKHIFLNTEDPFCMVCLGTQGGGKSHTMNVALENCLMAASEPFDLPVITQSQKMCGLIFHHSQSDSTVCEGVGLRELTVLSQDKVSGVNRVVVLVSPTYYQQRKHFYGEFCEVKPLLFRWNTLGAKQIKTLMRLSDKDNPLYVSVLLSLLRLYQRNQQVPDFNDFKKELRDSGLMSGQSAPLNQRLDILSQFIYEYDVNEPLRGEYSSFKDLLKPDTLVIADLTDPMLSPDEASGIFHVLLDLFRKAEIPGCGKVLACDEAHKYLGGSGAGQEALADEVVDLVRLMRHEGMRILISTQSPLTMPAELLELVSVMVLHHFQSKDWYKYLAAKIDMPDNAFDRVTQLKPGEALVVCSTLAAVNTAADDNTSMSQKCFEVKMRCRLTYDFGESKTNGSTAV